MQAHILSLRAPAIPGVGSKCQNFFLKVVMLHIKLKGIEHRAPCKHIIYPYVHLSGVGSKGQNIYFLKVVMLYIKFKGMEHTAKCKHIFCPQTHLCPLGWGQKVIFLKVVMLHIELKGMEHRASCKHNIILSLRTPSTP